jgi:hypothetical protein
LLALFLIYTLLIEQGNLGKLPMYLIILGFATWLTSPIVFSPLPNFSLMMDDVTSFSSFIFSKAGMIDVFTTGKNKLSDTLKRGDTGKWWSVFEIGFTDTYYTWSEPPLWVIIGFMWSRILTTVVIWFILPASIVDFVYIWMVVFTAQTVLMSLSLVIKALRGSNVVTSIYFLMFLGGFQIGGHLIGDQAHIPTVLHRSTEYFISFLVMMQIVASAREFLYVIARVRLGKDEDKERLQEAIYWLHFFMWEYFFNQLRACFVMLINILVTLVLIGLDRITHKCFWAVHTGWVLNKSLASHPGLTRGEPYMQKVN